MCSPRAHAFADYDRAAKCSELPRKTPSRDRAWTYYYGGGGGVENSRSLRYEILSHIIEFLRAFSRLAMFLLTGLISEDDSPARGTADRAENACVSRASR